MRPWENFKSVPEKKVDKKSLLNIGSLLYHTVLDLFRSKLVIHKDNQNHLSRELKVKARARALMAMEDDPYDGLMEELVSDKGKPEPEPIKGFLTKNHLSCFFVDRKT